MTMPCAQQVVLCHNVYGPVVTHPAQYNPGGLHLMTKHIKHRLKITLTCLCVCAGLDD